MIDDLIGKIPGLCQVSFLTSSLPEVSTALSRGEYGVLEVSSALSRIIPALNLYRKR